MPIDVLTVREFEDLLEHQHENSLSIYLPTHREGKEIQQNSIRFKNLLREGKERLVEKGFREGKVEGFLVPLQELQEDQEFWKKQSDGLAVLYNGDSLHTYRLPYQFEELVMVHDRFYIKPLIPVLVDNQRYYTLALSQEQIRLLAGTHFSLSELELGDTPDSMAEALHLDDPERRLQQHTSVPSPAGAGQEMFHGHDPDNQEQERKAIERFFSQVDSGVMDRIGDDSASLILAGTDKMVSIYREKNSYPHLMDEHIPGNPDDLTSEELRKASWEIIAPYLEAQHLEAVNQYHALADRGQASDDLEDVVPAAVNARVETLFVPLGEQIWGVYDPEGQTVELKPEGDPGSRDLLDFAALHTLQNGGMVYAVDPEDLPTDAPGAAAVFRY